MNAHDHEISDENVRFFGNVVASISHEIKNVMAIINEKAGLLKDLTLMAQKGISLDMNRIQSIADDVKVQIKRGDAIIKNMNKFAHSIDEVIQEVTLNDLTGLMTSLSERFASRFGATLIFMPAQEGLTIRTQPFLLEFILWECIKIALERCGEDKTITIAVEKSDPGALIKFFIRNENFPESIPIDGLSRQLQSLRAGLAIQKNEPQMILSLPKDISISNII
jgi:signal transduction histidine kinase